MIARVYGGEKLASARIDLKPRLLLDGERALGPGKADLLEHIARLGSISAAAKAMEMSYSRAWALVDTMNQSFTSPLVIAATGGTRGGGAEVTPLGRSILAQYREMQTELANTTAAYLPRFKKHLK
jgi:molybdate transport system regulatory protein